MMELKTYLVGMLRSLEKDYQVENIMFETTDDGYRIVFKSELDDEENSHVIGDKKIRGEWHRNVEIEVKLGTKFFKAWKYSEWHGICPCDNCEKIEEVTDKDKIAPSG